MMERFMQFNSIVDGMRQCKFFEICLMIIYCSKFTKVYSYSICSLAILAIYYDIIIIILNSAVITEDFLTTYFNKTIGELDIVTAVKSVKESYLTDLRKNINFVPGDDDDNTTNSTKAFKVRQFIANLFGSIEASVVQTLGETNQLNATQCIRQVIQV